MDGLWWKIPNKNGWFGGTPHFRKPLYIYIYMYTDIFIYTYIYIYIYIYIYLYLYVYNIHVYIDAGWIFLPNFFWCQLHQQLCRVGGPVGPLGSAFSVHASDLTDVSKLKDIQVASNSNKRTTWLLWTDISSGLSLSTSSIVMAWNIPQVDKQFASCLGRS